MKEEDFKMPKPVTIKQRISSITNAFVSGIVPAKEPSYEEIQKALKVLGQSEGKVRCVYCGGKMTLWDHLNPLIKNKKHSGYITEIANLVPACSDCNSSKGNSNWKKWMTNEKVKKSPKARGIKNIDKKIKFIEAYEKEFTPKTVNLEEIVGKELWQKYLKVQKDLEKSMNDAQEVMAEIIKITKPKPAKKPRVTKKPMATKKGKKT